MSEWPTMETVSTELFVDLLHSVFALYGNDTQYMQLREFVASYLEAELPFFRMFITDPLGPKHHVQQIRTDGVWADNIEIQIISEIYNCRIEILTTSKTPIKVFNEKPVAIKVPIRVLYLQQSHYDLIWDPKRHHPLQNTPFGQLERVAIQEANSRDRLKGEEPNQKSQSLSDKTLQKLGPTKESRLFFENSRNLCLLLVKSNFVNASKESMKSLETDLDKTTLKAIQESEAQMEKEQIEKAIKESMQYQESIKSATNDLNLKPQNFAQPKPQPKEGNSIKLLEQLIGMGFSTEEALEALKQLGPNATLDALITKITTNRDMGYGYQFGY